MYYYSAYVDDQKIIQYNEHKEELKSASDADDFLDAVKKIDEYIKLKAVRYFTNFTTRWIFSPYVFFNPLSNFFNFQLFAG